MTVNRCPKHDVLFESNKPPTQDGHAKCPICKRERDPASPHYVRVAPVYDPLRREPVVVQPAPVLQRGYATTEMPAPSVQPAPVRVVEEIPGRD
jgi:hypothetical protein